MERRIAALVISGFLLCACVGAQSTNNKSVPDSGTPAPKPDIYGRDTPRDTVLGFLAAARNADYQTAARYLNTQPTGAPAAELARKLFVVLDQRLPARLNQLSDEPEGSLSYQNDPDRELVGRVSGSSGKVDITLEHADPGKTDSIWLFSRKTLEAIPVLYEEVTTAKVEHAVLRFLVDTRIAGVALAAWLGVVLGLPLMLYSFAVLNKLLGSVAGRLRRRLLRDAPLTTPELLPKPLGLLIAAGIFSWTASEFVLPLLTRQFCRAIAALLAIVGCVWLVIRLNAWGERRIIRKFERHHLTGALSFLRFARGMINLLVVFAGFLVMLYRWGVDLTAALTGLGVGGIAVALAAQKTLENVIGGVSLIFDRAVRVGEVLKVGDTVGTVQDVGLRSIQIRTPDRTVVNVPNSQIASMSLENISLRDQFWFHHILGLAYDTTASQVRSIVQELSRVLLEHPAVDRSSVRVSFLRFGTSSLDLELFAYCSARDWNHFLEIQGGLLLQAMDTVQAAGSKLALPSQLLYAASAQKPAQSVGQKPARKSAAKKAAAGEPEPAAITRGAT